MEPSHIVQQSRNMSGSVTRLMRNQNIHEFNNSIDDRSLFNSMKVDEKNGQSMFRSGEIASMPYIQDDQETIEIKQHIPQQDELDVDFLPVSRSLKGNGLVREEWMDFRWRDMQSTMPGANIFSDAPRPDDIVQGEIGNAYFLAGLSALAEKPYIIQKIVKRNENPK